MRDLRKNTERVGAWCCCGDLPQREAYPCDRLEISVLCKNLDLYLSAAQLMLSFYVKDKELRSTMNLNKKIKKSIVGWLIKNAGKSNLGICIIAFGRAGISASAIALALEVKKVIDGAADGDKEAFFASLLISAGILILQDALCSLCCYMEERTATALEKRFKEQLYRCLLRADYTKLGEYHSGDLMNYLNGDVGIIVTDMLSIFSGLASMFVSLAGAAAVLVVWDWKFCLVFLAGGLLMLFAAGPLRRKMKQLHKDVRREYDNVQSFQLETVENMIMIRSFFAEKTAEKLLGSRMDLLRKARMRRNRLSNISYTGFYSAMDMGYLLGLLWYGMGVLNGQVTFGTLMAALQLVGQVQRPFANIGSFLPQYYAMCASGERIRELEDLPKETISKSLPGGRAYYESMAGIEVCDLSFSYGRNQVLEHADITIQKGDLAAFTGASGSGKSTLIKLLLALYKPVGGEIRLFDCKGQRIPVTPAARELFAYVPQENCIMSGDIYEVVRFLHVGKKFTEEEKKKIRSACEIACADEFIQEMPKKYETVIGEHGAGLSQGQKQRLAIARAIYSDAPILLLDEATSALDETTEEQVVRNLQNMNGKTVLIVTHRKKTLSICNRIIKISNKKFKEEPGNDRVC